jgi:D-serine deaminase-like pyridoxal phosphate-dependent protein
MLMARIILRTAAGITVGLGVGAQQLHAAGDPVSSCLADVDQGGRAASHIEQLVLRRDSTYLTKLGLLPADTSDVALVTDSATCDAALSAYNAHMSTKAGRPVAAVFVVKAGTNRFAVLNPTVAAGEFTYFVIFDSSWTFIHEFAG